MQKLSMLFAITGAIAATGGHAGPPPPRVREHAKGGPEVIANAEAKRIRKAAKRRRDAMRCGV